VGTPDNPERLWFFEECAKIGKQLPYPLVSSVFVQQLGGPPEGEFPKEAVSIQIPPSTHFGYMLEWALLAILTLTLGIGLQLLPLHPLGFERLRLNEKGGPLIN
jgi:cytochrome oxidase assembly protein ShyY1